MWIGDAEGAIAAVERARVFDPTLQWDYLSPLGFAYSTRVYMLELEKVLAHADVEVVNPWDDFEAFQALRAVYRRPSTSR